MAQLQLPLAIDPNIRFKYSNHGFGLLGLAIEAITGEPYRAWIEREIIDAVGRRETAPSMPIAKGVPFARRPPPPLPPARPLAIPPHNFPNAITPPPSFPPT